MSRNGALIRLEEATKVYRMGRYEFTALRGVDLAVERGEFVAVVGPSGSGKSTILNIMTGIDKPTAGKVWIGDTLVSSLNENKLAKWRGQNIGIVFQFFQLLPTLTAIENVTLPMDFLGTYRNGRRKRALEVLELVGLATHANHLPSEMSGGEQQRVAIARALANDPPIIIADEPTGNLDTENGQKVIDILTGLHQGGKTIVFVTHDPNLAERAPRLVRVKDGLIEPA